MSDRQQVQSCTQAYFKLEDARKVKALSTAWPTSPPLLPLACASALLLQGLLAGVLWRSQAIALEIFREFTQKLIDYQITSEVVAQVR